MFSFSENTTQPAQTTINVLKEVPVPYLKYGLSFCLDSVKESITQ